MGTTELVWSRTVIYDFFIFQLFRDNTYRKGVNVLWQERRPKVYYIFEFNNFKTVMELISMFFEKQIELLKALIILNFSCLKYIVASIRDYLLAVDKSELINSRPLLKASNMVVEKYIVYVYHLKDRMDIYIWNNLIMIIYRNWIVFMDDQDELHIFNKKILAKKWDNAKNRCYRKSSSSSNNYLDRGITLCSEWFGSSKGFIVWSVLFGGYYQGSVIDRIDNDMGYEPKNIRYVSYLESLNNKRNNIRFRVDNEEKTVSEWSRKTGIDYHILQRLYHSDPKALEDMLRNAIEDTLDDGLDD